MLTVWEYKLFVVNIIFKKYPKDTFEIALYKKKRMEALSHAKIKQLACLSTSDKVGVVRIRAR
jgi:hypothetical protein